MLEERDEERENERSERKFLMLDTGRPSHFHPSPPTHKYSRVLVRDLSSPTPVNAQSDQLFFETNMQKRRQSVLSILINFVFF